jgi:hypothetical protein
MELNISDKGTINNSCNLNSTSLAKIQVILDYLDWTQFLEKDIPVVTILGVICILGIFGFLFPDHLRHSILLLELIQL